MSTVAPRNMPVSIHCAKCTRMRILSDPFIFMQGHNPGSLIYGKMQVRGNPYSGIFYAVYVYFNNIVQSHYNAPASLAIPPFQYCYFIFATKQISQHIIFESFEHINSIKRAKVRSLRNPSSNAYFVNLVLKLKETVKYLILKWEYLI